jgi:uncharacterized protein YkwD
VPTPTRARTAVVFTLCILTWPLAAAAQGSADEAEAVRLVNAARAEANLPPLVAEPSFVEFVRGHSAEMVARRALYHSASPVRRAAAPRDWRRLGENVGYGDTVPHVHAQFMESPPHRDNILGDFTSLAVGTRRSADGLVFITMVFVKLGPSPQMVARHAQTP